MLIVPGLGLAVVWLLRVIPPELRERRAALAAWWVSGSAVWSAAFIAAGRAHDVTHPVWLAWGVATGSAGALLAIDVLLRRLPRQIGLTAFAVTAVLLAIGDGSRVAGTAGVLIGAAVMTIITLVLRLLSRGSLGIGDVFVSPMLGAVVGWFDPLLALWVWVIAACCGGVVALVVALRRGRDRMMPYGPFLLLGTAVVLFGTAMS